MNKILFLAFLSVSIASHAEFILENEEKPKKDVEVTALIEPKEIKQENWSVSPSDGTVRKVLTKWALRADWQLQWDAAVDVPVPVAATFTGDFKTAVNELFSSLSSSDVNITGLLYNKNKVLRVTESGIRAQ